MISSATLRFACGARYKARVLSPKQKGTPLRSFLFWRRHPGIRLWRRFFRLAAYEQARRALRRECEPDSASQSSIQSESVISKTKRNAIAFLFVLEATPGFEPGDRGVADLCLTTWPCRLIAVGVSRLYYHIPFREYWLQKIGRVLLARSFGADYGDRTRHLDLGKVALYQMS